MMLELKNPETYLGHSKHPAEDPEKRKVISAQITLTGFTSGYDLNIHFEGGHRFYDYSETIRGAKMKFAFQCKAGSKWDVLVK